jgi:hypothetical protein
MTGAALRFTSFFDGVLKRTIDYLEGWTSLILPNLSEFEISKVEEVFYCQV